MASPGRGDTLDFRRQLETKYTSKGRTPAQTDVDMEGESTWIGEYDWYRVNGCDHATAVQKTLAQVDGAAASDTCLVTCTYAVDSPKSAPAAGGEFYAEPDRRSGSCEWLAQSASGQGSQPALQLRAFACP